MRIGFFYIKAGNGHYIPAKAMYEKALEMCGDDSAILADFYRDVVQSEEDAIWTQKMWSKLMLESKREVFESWLYNNNILLCKTFHKYFLVNKFKKKFKMYMSKNPLDAIVATNCVIACIIGRLVKVCKINIPVYYYCSDVVSCYKFAARDKDISGFIAPSSECFRDLKIKRAKNIIKTAFPLQNQIRNSQKLSKIDAKRALGIKEDEFSLLFQLGGEGEGRFKLLKMCSDEGLNVNFIILGKLSEGTQEALDELQEQYPNIRVTTPGFVTNVQDYVCASDIVMSQSGLNSIMESLYLERPVLLSLLFYVGYPMKAFIEKNRVGFCATTPKGQLKCLKKLIEEPEILEEYENNIRALDLRYDSSKVIEEIMRRWER